MSSSLERYSKLSSTFLEVSLREQLLILFCGLVVVILTMYTLLLEPLLDNSEKLQQNSMAAKKEMAILVGQVAALTDKLKTDPNDPVSERIGILQRQIQNIDELYFLLMCFESRRGSESNANEQIG